MATALFNTIHLAFHLNRFQMTPVVRLAPRGGTWVVFGRVVDNQDDEPTACPVSSTSRQRCWQQSAIGCGGSDRRAQMGIALR